MGLLPDSKSDFWAVKRWVAHKVPASAPPTGDDTPTQPPGNTAPKMELKPTQGGFGFCPLFEQYAESVSDAGRVKVFAQPSISFGQLKRFRHSPRQGNVDLTNGESLSELLSLLECKSCSNDPRRAVLFCVACGAVSEARRRDGATFRRCEAPGAAYRPHEKAMAHYVVTEIAMGEQGIEHPGSPLPLVSSLYLANCQFTFGQVSLFGSTVRARCSPTAWRVQDVTRTCFASCVNRCSSGTNLNAAAVYEPEKTGPYFNGASPTMQIWTCLLAEVYHMCQFGTPESNAAVWPSSKGCVPFQARGALGACVAAGRRPP